MTTEISRTSLLKVLAALAAHPTLMLTTTEAAKVLRTTRTTVHRWVNTGRMPVSVRTPGGQLRFSAGTVLTARERSTAGWSEGSDAVVTGGDTDG